MTIYLAVLDYVNAGGRYEGTRSITGPNMTIPQIQFLRYCVGVEYVCVWKATNVYSSPMALGNNNVFGLIMVHDVDGFLGSHCLD